MASSSPENGEETPFVPFTKAERIRQLNDIDKSVTNLLKSAGLALQVLTTAQTQSQPSPDRRGAFMAGAETYIKNLHAVDVRITRHILGLEEEEIVRKEEPTPKEKAEQTSNASEGKDIASINDGSMGKLDTGYLNSKSGSVGWVMEAELWAKARCFGEELAHTGGEKIRKDPDTQMGE